MKRLILLTIIGYASFLQAFSQEKMACTAILQQTGMYYASDVVTSDGFGFGIGVHLLHPSQIAGQADANILWGNGNAITTRLALGYERKGRWTPGIYGTGNMIWGQRIELLTDSGERPPIPAWALGIRVVPLKFKGEKGFVSALEFGYGIGPDKGRSLEFTLLLIGWTL